MRARIAFCILTLLPLTAHAQAVGTLGVLVAPCVTGCGIIITGVIPGTTAQAAGLLPGDIIVQIDGQYVFSNIVNVSLYISARPLQVSILTIARLGGLFNIPVILEPRLINPNISPPIVQQHASPNSERSHPPSTSSPTVINNFYNYGDIRQENVTNQKGNNNNANQSNRRY